MTRYEGAGARATRSSATHPTDISSTMSIVQNVDLREKRLSDTVGIVSLHRAVIQRHNEVRVCDVQGR